MCTLKNLTAISNETTRIAVIGLGYVGLPLALAFSKYYNVLGFDIDPDRIAELKVGKDRTKETNSAELLNALTNKSTDKGLILSSAKEDIRFCNTYIITVPTPIDAFKVPDLTFLIRATEFVGSVLDPGDLVIYESTVYPGCTEEDCVPVLERVSNLQFNQDFFVGYSPERISPGDKTRKLSDIVKVTSGSTPEVAERVDIIYRSIILAGTHKASSIKVAEAAKAVENAQRDVNISFVNELALIFDRLDIDTHEVLEAASTKWNFLPHKPGLVGGHCIGVDPYYLAFKAERVGYISNVILSGRRVNEQMGAFVTSKTVKLMLQKDISLKGARALVMGITFKENCPDVRNSGVLDIFHELVAFGLDVDVYDPWANVEEVQRKYGIAIKSVIDNNKKYEAIIIAVAHREFLNIDYSRIKAHKSVIFDIKGILKRELVDARL